MYNKDNYLNNAELSIEQNCNIIDGIPNNTALPIPPSGSLFPCNAGARII